MIKATNLEATMNKSVQEIVNSIPRGARLQAAEARLSSLRQRRDEIATEIRTLIAAPRQPGAGAPDLTPLEAERVQVETEITGLRREITAPRAAYAERVRDALLPLRREAAARALAALNALDLATDVMIQVHQAVEQCGLDLGRVGRVGSAELREQATRWAK